MHQQRMDVSIVNIFCRLRVEALQRRFNDDSRSTKLELVLFGDALTHLTRISRLLAMERNNVLLVGVGGSGKQSLARLAAYIAGASKVHVAECSEIETLLPFDMNQVELYYSTSARHCSAIQMLHYW